LILCFRVMLLAVALLFYFVNRELLDFTNTFGLEGPETGIVFQVLVWIVLVFGMLFRIIPNKKITLGARKHYSQSFIAKPDIAQSNARSGCTSDGTSTAPDAEANLHRGAAMSALSWLIVSAAVLFSFHQLGILSPATVLLWTLLLSVVDLIFVIFLCPFQVLFMRNRCCEDCRIYNWDYFMMCAPLILFPSIFSVSLVLLSVVVLIRWEVAVKKHPHYFMKDKNAALGCEACEGAQCRFRINRRSK